MFFLHAAGRSTASDLEDAKSLADREHEGGCAEEVHQNSFDDSGGAGTNQSHVLDYDTKSCHIWCLSLTPAAGDRQQQEKTCSMQNKTDFPTLWRKPKSNKTKQQQQVKKIHKKRHDCKD